MSRPRPVNPGVTVLVTRRVHHRVFALAPNDEVRKIFGYALASAAAKHGVLIHGVKVMSNHHHTVVTDVKGVLPNFLRDFHKETACALNAHYGEWGSVWASEPTSVVRLLTAEAVLDELVYTLTNAVSAGLVKTYADWPGLHSSPSSCARSPVVFRRPSAYFDERRPDEVELVISVPPAFKHLSPAQFGELLSRRVATAEANIQASFATAGRKFLGAKKVLRTPRHTQATSREKRRAIRPTLAARDAETRRLQLAADKDWLLAYSAALTAWREGERSVEFPTGTWLMVQVHRASCAPPLRSVA